MASIRRRGKRWFVEVYVGGIRRGKTCDTKGEAAGWALRMEQELRQPVEPTRTTLGEACARYREHVVPQHNGAKWERIRLLAFERDAIACVAMADLTTARLAEWRDARLRVVSPGTVKRELVLLGCVLEACRLDWGLLSINPLRDLRKPKAPSTQRHSICNPSITPPSPEPGRLPEQPAHPGR